MKLEALRKENKDRWSQLSTTAVLPHDDEEFNGQMEVRLRCKMVDIFPYKTKEFKKGNHLI